MIDISGASRAQCRTQVFVCLDMIVYLIFAEMLLDSEVQTSCSLKMSENVHKC